MLLRCPLSFAGPDCTCRCSRPCLVQLRGAGGSGDGSEKGKPRCLVEQTTSELYTGTACSADPTPSLTNLATRATRSSPSESERVLCSLALRAELSGRSLTRSDRVSGCDFFFGAFLEPFFRFRLHSRRKKSHPGPERAERSSRLAKLDSAFLPTLDYPFGSITSQVVSLQCCARHLQLSRLRLDHTAAKPSRRLDCFRLQHSDCAAMTATQLARQSPLRRQTPTAQ